MKRTSDNDLTSISRQVMIDRGLLADFSPQVRRELRRLKSPLDAEEGDVKDLRKLPWCSIDNDDSRDIDQLTASEKVSRDVHRILVAVADVDAVVKKGTAVDLHAKHNTTTVYCPTVTFTMIPEALCYDVTSLNEGEDRLAVVIDMEVGPKGRIRRESVYRAWVRNKAQLAYPEVGAWLEGQTLPPEKVRLHGLEQQLRIQDRMAQRLRWHRHLAGALDLETIEPKAVITGGRLVDLTVERKNRAHELIENFMIAANGVTARYLQEVKFPVFRRVVRSPERWSRIVALAKDLGETLPPEASSKALEAFLQRRREADPLRFPDLSLTVVKLMGRGEYVAQLAGQYSVGHFGLAVKDYAHSTAPNRRYPDVITQRLLKAALAGRPIPYANDELQRLADHCTEREDDANKVERQSYKSAAAKLLLPHVGKRFDGVITGASDKGTWVRLFHPPVEGRMTRGFKGLDVGDVVRVKLTEVDVERGFIDFEKSRG
jgi:exoribonuclease-2